MTTTVLPAMRIDRTARAMVRRAAGESRPASPKQAPEGRRTPASAAACLNEALMEACALLSPTVT